MYYLHRISECADLLFSHLCYFVFMLQLVFSDNYFEKDSFKLVCGKPTYHFTTYINVRSQVICAGICARLDKCVGIKFDNSKKCMIYQELLDCDKLHTSSCLFFKQGSMLDHNSSMCKKLETLNTTTDLSTQIPKSTIKIEDKMFSRDIQSEENNTLTTIENVLKTKQPGTEIKDTTYSVISKTGQTTQSKKITTTETLESIASDTTGYKTLSEIEQTQANAKMKTEKMMDSTSATMTLDQTDKIITEMSANACEINAATKLKDSYLLISGFRVYFYNSVNDMLTGVGSSGLVLDTFPQVTGQITAAYTSLTFDHVYVLVGKTVYTYTLPSYTYIGKQTVTEHFGIKNGLSFVDNIIVYENGVHVFSTSTELIRIHNTRTDNLKFDDNGKGNPYRSSNQSERPTKITAVCHLSDNVVLFFQSNIIHKIEFGSSSGGKGLWTELGKILCF